MPVTIKEQTTTLGAIAADFVRWKESQLAAGTISAPALVVLKSNVKNIVTGIGADTPLDHIKRDTGNHYIGTRRQAGVSPATINREIMVLKAMLKMAMEEGYLAAMPKLFSVRVDRVEKKLPTVNDVLATLEDMPLDEKWVMRFAIHTGLSWSEIKRLEWQDIEPTPGRKWGRVAIGQRPDFVVKTPARRRYVPLSHEAWPAVAWARARYPETPKPTDKVFPFAHLAAATLKRNRSKKHPAIFTPAVARKLFASHAATVMPEPMLQRIMGHAPGSTVTRRHYVSVPENLLDDAMKAASEAISGRSPRRKKNAAAAA